MSDHEWTFNPENGQWELSSPAPHLMAAIAQLGTGSWFWAVYDSTKHDAWEAAVNSGIVDTLEDAKADAECALEDYQPEPEPISVAEELAMVLAAAQLSDGITLEEIEARADRVPEGDRETFREAVAILRKAEGAKP